MLSSSALLPVLAALYSFYPVAVEGTGGTGLADFLTTAGNLVVSAMGIVWNIITGNVILTAFVGVSLISIGFGIFRRAKSAAKH